jgi:hypothetical protein
MKVSLTRVLLTAAVSMLPAVSQAGIAVVVSRDYPIESMSTAEVAAVYLGKDARLEPIDLPESVQLRHWFYYKVTGRDVRQVKIIWAQMFAKFRPPKVASGSAEAIRRVAASKRAIAYVDERAVDASVKVVMKVQNPPSLNEKL